MLSTLTKTSAKNNCILLYLFISFLCWTNTCEAEIKLDSFINSSIRLQINGLRHDFQKIIKSNDGNFLLFGSILSANALKYDSRYANGLLLKMSPGGQILWQKEIGFYNKGSGSIVDLIEDGPNIVGIMKNTIFKYHPSDDQLIWMKEIDNNFITEYLDILNPEGKDHYIIIGKDFRFTSRSDLVWTAIDKHSGEIKKLDYYDIEARVNFQHSVLVDRFVYLASDAQIIQSGHYGRGLAISKFDTEGTLLFRNNYIFNSKPIDIENTIILPEADGLVILTSVSNSISQKNTSTIFKIDFEGNPIWSKEIKVPFHHIFPWDLKWTSNGYLAVFINPLDFISSPGRLFLHFDFNGNILGSQFNPISSNFLGLNMYPKAGILHEGNYIVPTSSNSLESSFSEITTYREGASNCLELQQLNISTDTLFIKTENSPYEKREAIVWWEVPKDSIILRNSPLKINDITDCDQIEICGNGIDDDGNGLIDEKDPTCNSKPNGCGDNFIIRFENGGRLNEFNSVVADSNYFYLAGAVTYFGTMVQLSEKGKIKWVHELYDGDQYYELVHDLGKVLLGKDGMLYCLDNGVRGIAKLDPFTKNVIWSVELDRCQSVALDDENNRLYAVQFKNINEKSTLKLLSISTETGEIIDSKGYILESSERRGGSHQFKTFILANEALYLGIGVRDPDNYELNTQILRIPLHQPNEATSQIFKHNLPNSQFRISGLAETPNGILALVTIFEEKRKDIGNWLYFSPGFQLVQMDFEGTVLWKKEYKLEQVDSLFVNYWAMQTVDDNIFIHSVGSYKTNHEHLIRLNGQGNPVWSKKMTGNRAYGFEIAFGKDLLFHEDNLYWLGKSSNSDDLIYQNTLVKLSLDGSIPNCNSLILEDHEISLVPSAAITTGSKIDLTEVDVSENADKWVNTKIIGRTANITTNFSCTPSECCEPDLVIQTARGTCNGDSLAVHINTFNAGLVSFSDSLSVAFYTIPNNNNLAEPFFQTTLWNNELVQSDSATFDLLIPYPSDSIFLVVINNAGQSDSILQLSAGIHAPSLECNYDNNSYWVNWNKSAPTLDIGADTTVCSSDFEIRLTADTNFFDFQWSNGNTDTSITIDQAGQYWLSAKNYCNDLVTDTIKIRQESIDRASIAVPDDDHIYCMGERLHLWAGFHEDIGYDYHWTNEQGEVLLENSREFFFNINQDTTIFLTQTLNGNCSFTARHYFPVTETCTYEDSLICDKKNIWIEDFRYKVGDTAVVFSNRDSAHFLVLKGAEKTFHSIDTAICQGDSLWFQNEYLQAGSQKTFRLTNVVGCDSVIRINVRILYNPSVDIREGDTDCATQTAELYIPFQLPPTYQINWSNGATQSRIKGIPSGSYGVTLTDEAGCTAEDSIELEVSLPDLEFQLQTQDVSCFGMRDGGVIINHISGAKLPFTFEFKGQFYEKRNFVFDLKADFYELEVKDANNCIYKDSFEILEPPKLEITLPSDTMVDLGEFITLSPIVTGNGPFEMEWFPTDGLDCTFCPNPTFQAERRVRYQLQVTDQNFCGATVAINVEVDREKSISVPDAFSPNMDGVNDYFGFFHDNDILLIESVVIVSRQGLRAFSRNSIPPDQSQAIWDGRSNGRNAPVGSYIYYIQAKFIDGESKLFTGTVILVR